MVACDATAAPRLEGPTGIATVGAGAPPPAPIHVGLDRLRVGRGGANRNRLHVKHCPRWRSCLVVRRIAGSGRSKASRWLPRVSTDRVLAVVPIQAVRGARHQGRRTSIVAPGGNRWPQPGGDGASGLEARSVGRGMATRVLGLESRRTDLADARDRLPFHVKRPLPGSFSRGKRGARIAPAASWVCRQGRTFRVTHAPKAPACRPGRKFHTGRHSPQHGPLVWQVRGKRESAHDGRDALPWRMFHVKQPWRQFGSWAEAGARGGVPARAVSPLPVAHVARGTTLRRRPASWRAAVRLQASSRRGPADAAARVPRETRTRRGQMADRRGQWT